jgi:hypothetical protein
MFGSGSIYIVSSGCAYRRVYKVYNLIPAYIPCTKGYAVDIQSAGNQNRELT